MNSADPILRPDTPDAPEAPGMFPASPRGYQYKHGDRPLDGYTIQRAAGRGGFGEVYYAVSDGGREVALKVIQTFEQIELRGLAHCMNLKSPHLVTVFDVKYGNDGRPWVVMEFVSGPSLRELIDAAPTGLGPQKAAFFLREIGKGLTYLHDCGIVHRDLKPGNIFFENGYVKIGDYGLSKAIGPGQHTGQTVTVGTVHYMAPEIGQGRYDKGIDIYALGALLYEMLTGQVPFLGASPAEVLMKHLSSDADLSGVAEPFATVIRKAMAKDPAQRYATVQEMVEAVFGAEHVRNSVSHFSPDSLTMVAGRVVRQAGTGSAALGSFTPSDSPRPIGAQGARRTGGEWSAWGDWGGRWGARCGDRLGRLFSPAPAAGAPRPDLTAADDPIPIRPRISLTAVTIVMASIATGAAGGMTGNSAWAGWFALLAITGATLAAGAGRRWLWPAVRDDSPLLRRLAIGGPAAVAALVFSFPVWMYVGAHHHPDELPDVQRTLGAVLLCLLAMNWEAAQSVDRPQRLRLSGILKPAALALFLGLVLGADVPVVVGAIAGTALAVQIASPWSPSAVSRRRRGRMAAVGAPLAPPAPAGPARPVVPPPLPVVEQPSAPAAPAAVVAAVAVADSPEPQAATASSEETPPVAPPVPQIPRAGGSYGLVPKPIRILWLGAFVLFAVTGLFLLAVLMFDNNNSDESACEFGAAVATLIAAFVCLRRAAWTRYPGIWRYLLRPLIDLCCVASISMSLSILLFGRPGNDAPVAVFFLVCPVVVLLTLHLLVPRLLNPKHPDLPGEAMSAYAHPGPAGSLVAAGAASPLEESDFSVTGFLASLGRFTLTLLGSVLLLAALVAALTVAADVPGFFDAPWVDPQIHRDMRQTFGTADWARLFRDFGAVLSFVLATGSLVLLLIARRRSGGLHMLRAVLGTVLLLAAVAELGHALPAWSSLPGSSNPWELADQLAARLDRPMAVGAGGIAVAGLFLLLVPAGRGRGKLQPARELAAGQVEDVKA